MRHFYLKIIAVITLSAFCNSTISSQNIDSLWISYLNKNLHDTLRLEANDVLLHYYQNTNIDTALTLAHEQIELAAGVADSSWAPYALFNMGFTLFAADRYKESVETYEKAYELYKKRKRKLMGDCLSNMALGYLKLGDYKKSFSYYTKAKNFYIERKDSTMVARVYNQLAMVRDYEGRWIESLDLYFETLRQFEVLNDEYGISVSYINIATIYDQLKDKEQAKSYFVKAYELKQKIGDEYGEAIALANLAGFDSENKDYDNALKKFDKVIAIYKKHNATQMLGTTYAGLGAIYTEIQEYDRAHQYYSMGIDIMRKIEAEPNLAEYLGGLGTLYIAQKNSSKAIASCNEGLKLAIKTGFKAAEKRNCECLYRAYDLIGDTKNAYHYFKEFVSIKDSLINEENKQAATRKNLEFSFAKQKLQDSLEFAQKDFLSSAKIVEQKLQLDKEKTQKYALYAGIVLFMILGGVSFKSYQNKKRDNIVIAHQKQEVEKQNVEIENQRHILESKNKEITDSISYAKRIQDAILPSDKTIKDNLPNSFVLYKPKDIVAGDFFWIENVNGSILFAAADCTGHGVPGAMVSVVCHNALNRSVREFKLTNPGEILDKTRELVIEQFEKSEENVKDGMDISLCVLSKSKKTLKWAGAYNPLWIIRNNSDSIEEIKADKQPIGNYFNSKPFITHDIKLNAGDTLYVFSDGFQDQFGGKEKKKYKASNFKQLLIDTKQPLMDDQKQLINVAFEDWRYEMEQIDDVCIMGVRI